MRRALILLILVALVPIASGEASRAIGWEVVRLDSPGDVTVTIWVESPGRAAVGANIFSADGTQSMMMVGLDERSGPVVVLRDDDLGFKISEQKSTSIKRVQVIAEVTGPLSSHTAVVYAAGSAVDWGYSIEGGTVTPVSQGARTFFTDGVGFEGGRRADLDAGFGVQYMESAKYPFQVQGTLLGTVLPFGNEQGPVGWDDVRLTNGSSERQCPCRFMAGAGPARYGPGDYVLERSTFGLENGRETIFFGADVDLDFR